MRDEERGTAREDKAPTLRSELQKPGVQEFLVCIKQTLNDKAFTHHPAFRE
jgi:hypothetical protein